jgi:hypothetical protein
MGSTAFRDGTKAVVADNVFDTSIRSLYAQMFGVEGAINHNLKEIAMSRYVIGILVVGLLAVGGWAVAQQDRPGPKAPVPESGPFAASPAGQSAVLLDTKSGKTWVLTHSVKGQSVWLPARRIDSEEEARDWQEREKKIKEILGEKK